MTFSKRRARPSKRPTPSPQHTYKRRHKTEQKHTYSLQSRWACLFLVCAVGVLHAFLVCLPCLECCVRFGGLVFLLSPVLSPILSHLVWDAVFVLWACLHNFMCGFVQLFGVYGGVI